MTFFPGFNFGYGILNIASRESYYTYENLDELPTALDWNIAGACLFFLGVQIVLYFSLVFLLEYLMTNPKFRKLCEVETTPILAYM